MQRQYHSWPLLKLDFGSSASLSGHSPPLLLLARCEIQQIIRSPQRNAHPHFHPSVSISGSSSEIIQRRWPIASCGWNGPELLLLTVESTHHLHCRQIHDRQECGYCMLSFIGGKLLLWSHTLWSIAFSLIHLSYVFPASVTIKYQKWTRGLAVCMASAGGGALSLKRTNNGGFLKTDHNNHIAVLIDAKS